MASSLLRLVAAAAQPSLIQHGLQASPSALAPLCAAGLRLRPTSCRHYAVGKEQQQQGEDKAGAEASASGSKEDSGSSDEESASPEKLLSQLKEREEAALKLNKQVEGLTDSLKRTLADMENLRARTAREVDTVKKFAIQNFVKSLLDVPDNLERASESADKVLKEGGDAQQEKLRNALQSMLDGMRATESIMLKVLKQHGVERYDPTGQPFDPNLHNALFDVPDPSKENNIIAHVTKRGYKLNDRVIRPAEVGVVRNPSS